jgi:hypothetical protein
MRILRRKGRLPRCAPHELRDQCLRARERTQLERLGEIHSLNDGPDESRIEAVGAGESELEASTRDHRFDGELALNPTRARRL